MIEEERTDVLVAGGGPVGLVAAILLAEDGIETRIVDKEPGTATQSYACALHPASLQLLAQLGLEHELLSLGHRVDTVALYDGTTRRTDVRLSELSGDFPFVLVLPQSTLEEALEIRLARKFGTRIEWNHRLASIRAEKEKVAASVEKLTHTATGFGERDMECVVGPTLRISAGFLIGADGNRSQVRQCLGIDYDHVAPTMAFDVYEFETYATPEPEVRVVFDGPNTNVFWPLPGGRCRWSFEVTPSADADGFPAKDRRVISADQAAVEARTKAKLQRLISERAPWFQATASEVDWNAQVPFRPGLSRQFGLGRCWLAGDSAHQTGPVGMQSMNVGLGEAAELVAGIKTILRNQGSSDLLRAYESSRRREWQQLLGVTGGPRHRPETNSWIRGMSGRLVSCLPASGDHLLQLLDQIGLDLP